MITRRPGGVLAIVASVAMAAAVIAGLVVLGSPGHQRALQLDQRRVQALRTLSATVDGYWLAHHALPPRLDAMDPVSWTAHDPETGASFEYATTGGSGYRLCARFALASESDQQKRWTNPDDGRWVHPAGRHCFERTAGH